jgi:lactoylglutathione lyase
VRIEHVARPLAVVSTDAVDGPRRTGDGCYERVVLDPEGNRIETTV